MKIRLALAILMGTVVLAMGQTTPPTFDAIAETPTTITVLLTAGSEPINGFDIYWKGAGTRWQVSRFYVGLNCPGAARSCMGSSSLALLRRLELPTQLRAATGPEHRR